MRALVHNRTPNRVERLMLDLESAALTAEALARRMLACEELTTEQRAHSQRVVDAAFALCDTTVILHGCSTPDLRMAFGRYLGARALQRRTSGKEAAQLLDDDDD
ncbi:MAG: hypothetical protein KC492_16640 [Myxococcales bacterium]|nr:hypothetical protein [Myxococcales bacterium]